MSLLPGLWLDAREYRWHLATTGPNDQLLPTGPFSALKRRSVRSPSRASAHPPASWMGEGDRWFSICFSPSPVPARAAILPGLPPPSATAPASCRAPVCAARFRRPSPASTARCWPLRSAPGARARTRGVGVEREPHNLVQLLDGFAADGFEPRGQRALTARVRPPRGQSGIGIRFGCRAHRDERFVLDPCHFASS